MSLGVGPSGYLDAIPAYHDSRYERRVGPLNPPDSPHNWILQATIAGGVPLALLAIVLAGLTLQRGLRATRRQATGGEAAAVGGMLAGLVGYGTALLFHLTSPGTTPLAALLAGAQLATHPLPAPADAGSLRRPMRLTARAALVTLVIVLTGAAFAELPLRSAIDAAATGHFDTANHDFRAAQLLRPWDAEIDAMAAHAYATLASYGIAGAAEQGAPWAAKELAAHPDSVQALMDTAQLDLARNERAGARRLLLRALGLEPANAELRTQAARVEQAGSGPAHQS